MPYPQHTIPPLIFSDVSMAYLLVLMSQFENNIISQTHGLFKFP